MWKVDSASWILWLGLFYSCFLKLSGTQWLPNHVYKVMICNRSWCAQYGCLQSFSSDSFSPKWSIWPLCTRWSPFIRVEASLQCVYPKASVELTASIRKQGSHVGWTWFINRVLWINLEKHLMRSICLYYSLLNNSNVFWVYFIIIRDVFKFGWCWTNHDWTGIKASVLKTELSFSLS